MLSPCLPSSALCGVGNPEIPLMTIAAARLALTIWGAVAKAHANAMSIKQELEASAADLAAKIASMTQHSQKVRRAAPRSQAAAVPACLSFCFDQHAFNLHWHSHS
jgi:hypothetical protein